MKRFSNQYYLALSILVCFPFSPVMPEATAIPFALVLLWTSLTDLYEDFCRRRDDDRENSRECWRFVQKQMCFQRAKFREVLCGDIICAIGQQAFPADLFLLYAPQGEGVFLSSANLDGETSWKRRSLPGCVPEVMRKAAIAASGAGVPRWAAPTSSAGVGPRSSADARRRTRASVFSLPAQVAPPAEAVVVAEQIFARQADEMTLECEAGEPTASLWEASGAFRIGGSLASEESSGGGPGPQRIPLDGSALLPRGCVLQGCPWVLGVAVYIGKDTKSSLNSTVASAKVASVQKAFNRFLFAVTFTLVCVCLYLMIMSSTCQGQRMDAITGVTYLIILYHVLPVSLYVWFEIFKFILAAKIGFDPELVDPQTGEAAVARSAELVDELGQVSYVFSDKTGTLTENDMVLARVCLPGGHDMGDFRETEGEESPAQPAGCQEAQRILCLDGSAPASGTEEAERRQAALQLFYGFALCHSLLVRKDTEGMPVYVGASPEEIAFAEAASCAGIVLRSRSPSADGGDVLAVGVGETGQLRRYQILEVIEFNSDRKRMSVVVQVASGSAGEPQEILCITKGADNIMEPLLKAPLTQQEAQRLKDYASLGLRTMVVGFRQLEASFVGKWRAELAAAREAPKGAERDGLVATVEAQVESSLCLAGIAAIEDRLQAGVPRAVATLRRAGIRFWMLTGDKTETAVSIARSCGALSDLSELLYATSDRLSSKAPQGSGQTPEEMAASAARTLRDQVKARPQPGSSGVQLALVLDGAFFRHAHATPDARRALYEVTLHCTACVCCRLSPQQKQLLVEMVREFNPAVVTLAIGDGANDVPMIGAAHVGIGVRGKEGMQAVQASDVAISQFRFLLPLLLCHGRQNYRRVSYFLCFFIYKHVALAVGDVIWAHHACFKGHKAFMEHMVSAYVLASALPMFASMAYGQDVPDGVAVKSPWLYAEGPEQRHFNTRMFLLWVLLAIVHGSASWYVPFNLGGNSWEYDTGDFWMLSLEAFFGVVICISATALAIANKGSEGRVALSILACVAALLLSAVVLRWTKMQPELEDLSNAERKTIETSCLALGASVLVAAATTVPFSWLLRRDRTSIPGGAHSQELEKQAAKDGSGKLDNNVLYRTPYGTFAESASP